MSSDLKIAVVGLACRFPGARNKDEFWSNLVEGRESISHFSDEELSKTEYDYETLRANADYVKARGVISDIDKFDAEFFGISPREAAFMDPQHRIWLETAWEALEDAGCDPFRYQGSIGVFAGGSINTYMLNNVLRDPERLENYIRMRTAESYQIMIGNDVAFIPTKTAYKFNLRGPAINVQTACSTSLVAISQACQSLFSYESDVCLAGGVCIAVPQVSGYLFQEGAIPSPDGKCRPFDANGRGTVFSNGVGVVVLKRIDDAVRDKDRIYACVRGWALNNDGNNKVSYTAPGIEGQASAIRMAQSFAGVLPDEIGYVEAHGTATQLGDPIELEALSKVFSAKSKSKQFCGIGSVKSNIGHTDAAAGVASFIKACLSVYNRFIPATINYNSPNPHFDFNNSPFFVQKENRKWEYGKRLIVGVSSFGIGGTNAHVILEELPVRKELTLQQSPWPQLLILSAKTGEALIERRNDIRAFLMKNRGTNIRDMSYTLRSGRNHMLYRTWSVAENTDEFISKEIFPLIQKSDDKLRGVALMFSGQGAQYPGMGRMLYETVSEYRRVIDECFSIFRSETGSDLKQVLFYKTGESAARELSMTSITQPALFITEYALARLYEKFGIRPAYLIGHSIGEYAAACLSGVFDMESALKIVIKRGELMQRVPAGGMMAARCTSAKLEELSDSMFEIAAENSLNMCTISFNLQHAGRIQALLKSREINYVPLNTSHAFHSSAFNPVMQEFSEYVNRFTLKAPSIPFISCLTGRFITPDQATSPDYWSQQLRNKVKFRDGINTISKYDNVLFLEIGPDTHLSTLVKNNNENGQKAVVSSLGKAGSDDRYSIMNSLGNIWANGIEPDFSALDSGNEMKISLPGYPFQRKSYWIGHIPANHSFSSPDTGMPVSKDPGKKINPDGTIITELRTLLSESSGYPVESLNEEMSFEELGFDSLFLTQLAHTISKRYGIKMVFRQLISEYPTLKRLGAYISKEVLQPVGEKSTKPQINNFVKFQDGGTKDPLIIVHGQNADKFLPQYLGSDQPYFGFLHPGSDGEEFPWKNVQDMAQHYLSQLLIHKPAGPYILGGFSFGGILAFEMAVMLKKMGHEVPSVILFDSFSRPEPFRWHDSLFKIIKSNILVPPVMEALRIMKLTICKVNILLNKPTPVKFRNFYIVDNYYSMMRKYKPSKFDGRIVLFRAIENVSALRYLGWENHAAEISVIPLKAGHISMLTDADSIKTIQSEIKKIMDNVTIIKHEAEAVCV